MFNSIFTGVFRKLNESGIVARERFWCCGSCASAAMPDEVALEQAKGIQVRGFVFYHEQDADNLDEDGGCYLGFWSAGDDDSGEAAVQVGKEIVQALRADGFRVDWDGSYANRIYASK